MIDVYLYFGNQSNFPFQTIHSVMDFGNNVKMPNGSKRKIRFKEPILKTSPYVIYMGEEVKVTIK